MSDSAAKPDTSSNRNANASAGGGNAVYGLGMIGAAIYYFQQAETAGAYLFALPKAIVWPAFLVYEVLRYIG